MAINNHVVNTNGRGNNMFSQTWHAVRRTTDGKLYYQLRDKNVGTFNNGQGVLANDDDYVSEDVQFVSGISETLSGDGTTTAFTTTTNWYDATRIHITIDGALQNNTYDYTVSGTTLTFTTAPHNGANILIRLLNKRYFNQASDTFQQYRFEDSRDYYKINDSGYLVRVENKKVPLEEITDDYSSYNGSTLVNSTSWSSL